MPEGTQSLDSILEEAFAGSSRAAAAAAIPNFCQYWPYIKMFLEWAKGQTGNFIVKIIIDGLIKLGDQQCK